MTEKDYAFLEACKLELEPIYRSGGASWTQLTGLLYHVRLLRYMTAEQIRKLKYPKVRGKRKELVELGYLQEQGGVYRATPKTDELLKVIGIHMPLLKPDLDGYGGTDAVRKTEVFLRALDLERFKALLFPRFPKEEPYLIPDALLVEAESSIKYRLFFLEIEQEKADWHNHLEKKRANYERLGMDNQVYRYWYNVSEHLGLKKPSREQFCFSILCIGNIKKEWSSWSFKKEL
jgi:hypothetical protein